MKIGLLGMGTIGSGVYEILEKRGDIEVQRVLDLRKIAGLGDRLTARFEDILEDGSIDTVVELMGGLEPAHEYVVRSMRAGKNVVTANKLMVSRHFDEILRTSQSNDVAFRLSACVGGGIPYIHNLLRARRVDFILWVGGIVNGTTNLILDTMQSSGAGFQEALQEAQRMGYAEADPSSDIDGVDARSKLTIAMNLAFDGVADTNAVLTEGIRNLTGQDIRRFRELGYVCRFLSSARRLEGGAATAYVEPTLVRPDAPEAAVRKNDNMISFEGAYAGVQHFIGQGAGKLPTACAVVGDLIDLDRRRHLSPFTTNGAPIAIDNAQVGHRYYVRTAARLGIPAEKIDDRAYLTEPVSVARMHAHAEELRVSDPGAFFAGMRDE